MGCGALLKQLRLNILRPILAVPIPARRAEINQMNGAVSFAKPTGVTVAGLSVINLGIPAFIVN